MAAATTVALATMAAGALAGGKNDGGSSQRVEQISRASPYRPTRGGIQRIIDESTRIFEDNDLEFFPEPPPNMGPSRAYREAAREFQDIASDSPFVQGAESVFDQLLAYDPDNEFRERGLDGIEENQYLGPYIESIMDEAIGSGAAIPSGGGAFFARGDGGVLGDSALPFLMDVAEGGFLGENPYLDDVADAVRGDALETFEESALPTIQSEFAMAGGFNSALRQLAEGQAREEVSEGVARELADTRSENYQFERSLMDSALRMLSQRDIAEGNINASRASAGAASANAAADRRSREKLGLLGLALDAIGGVSEENIAEAQLNLEHANALDARQLSLLDGRSGLLSLVPALEEARLAGPLAGLDIEKALSQANARNISSLYDYRRRKHMFEQTKDIRNLETYRDFLFPIAQAFGTNTGNNTTIIPGSTSNRIANAITGAAGGFATGAGAGESIAGGKA